MRRTFLLLACLLLTSLQGWSEKVVYDSIYYEINEINHEARVTYYAPILGGAANGLYYKGDIVIPEIMCYKGEIYPVTGIGHWAFHDCPDITSVSIPSSVKEICHFAFENCLGLTEISIPESVTEIWRGTFQGCEGLNKVEFASIEQMCSMTYCPEVDENIQALLNELWQYPNSNPLYMAKHLWIDGQEVTDLVIPEGITSIGNLAFAGGAFTSVTIPESVTSIGHSAFRGCKDLTSFTIPDGVTSIGARAFEDCTGLTSITILDGVTSIGASAFEDCTGLTSITILDGVTSMGASAFEDCTGLTSITIPGSVTSIGEYAFTGCTRLPSVVIPEGVTSIGYGAFEDCTGLTSVSIPGSLTSWGGMEFTGCTGLTSITFQDGLTSIGGSAFYGCTSLTSVTFPESLTSIGGSAFSGCMGLTSITIPKNVTTVYGSTFRGCTNMESIVVENGNTVYDSRENCNAIIETATNTLLRACNSTVFPAGVTSIGASAFSGLADLTSFSIPESVTSIGSWAFSDCTGLTSITIPKSVTSIGSGAFSDCSGLTSITIPKSVTTIGSGAFSGCSGLTAFIIPNKVTTVGEYAFRGCTNLASVTIPKSVTSIGQGVFLECAGLTTIISKMTQPASISADLNYIDSNNITLYIPKGRKDAYISQGWSIFPTIIEFTDKDVNRDDVSDLVDVVEIARFSAGTPSAEFFETVADINEDYAVDNADASALLENIVSLTVSRGRILTSFKPNTWYFMFQTRDYGSGNLWAPGSSPNSGGYLTDMGDGQTIQKQSVNDVSNDSPFNDVASYLVRFIPTANEGGYYVQFGTGRYMSAPIGGGFKAVEGIHNAGEFNIYNIDADNPGYFGFNVYNMGARVDNNGVGGTVVTWQSGKHDVVFDADGKLASNSIWSIVGANINNVIGDISDGDSIQVADLNIGALATNLTIELNNTSDDLVAFQMDVTLPEGISLDPTGCTLSSRFADKEQRLNVTNSVGNTYRLTSASFALTPISGTDGALLDLSLTAYEGFVEGVAIISNVLFATSNSERVRMNDATCSIRNESYTLTYILDGETYKTFSIPLGGVITPEANPTKTGYTFSGWSEIPETMPNHDVTVTGTFAFTPAEYTLFDGTNYSLDCDAEVGTLHYSRTFKNTYWQAWYVPFDVTLTSELMAHFAFAKFAGTYTEEDGSFYITVVRLKEGDVVKANTPYCVQAKVADSSNPQIVTQTGATLKAAVVNSFYVLSAEKKITFFGNYTRRAVTEDDQNVYAMSGGKYSRQLSGNTLGSFRCFFTIEDREDNPYAITPNPAEVKLMVLGDDDGTGIAEVESEASGAEDEQGVVYDLSGRKLNGQNMRKGIYIVNGKKVFLK